MKKIIIIVLAVALSGCAAISTSFQHPVTKQVHKCEVVGIGWLGVPLAVASYYDCKDKTLQAGYVMMGEQ
jgi:hypothetical protein